MRQIGGFEDITPGRAADGIAALQMRAVHIIDTPPGGLPQDPEWGWGIRELIGENLGPGDLRLAEQVGRAAFRRDPEVKDATVTITPTGPASARVTVRLEAVGGIVDIERDIS